MSDCACSGCISIQKGGDVVRRGGELIEDAVIRLVHCAFSTVFQAQTVLKTEALSRGDTRLVFGTPWKEED